MSETTPSPAPQNASVPAPTSAAASSTASVSAGAVLRQAREEAGIHVEALAVALKVSPRKIEALERDQYDQLPDMVFVRALARSVCKYLKIDAEPVLATLPKVALTALPDHDRGLRETVQAGTVGPLRRKLPKSWSHPLMLAIPIILLATLSVYFWPVLSEHMTSVQASDQPEASVSGTEPPPPMILTDSGAANHTDSTAPTATAPPSQATPNPTPLLPAANTASTGTGTGIGSGEGNSTSVGASTLGASSATPVPKTAPQNGTAPASSESPPASDATRATSAVPATQALVSIKARSEVWVRVSDAQGAVLVEKVLRENEHADANTGTTPLTVTVGRADAVQVQVRGKSFDLAPVTRNNVARFEVK